MGASEGLFAAQTGLGLFSALTGVQGASSSRRLANNIYQSEVSAAGRNYTLQNKELNRQLWELNQDESDESSMYVREANSRLSSLSNSFGILDGATSNSLYRSEVFGFNQELIRIGRNFDRQRGAVRADKSVNRQNYQNAIILAQNRRANAVAAARQRSTQSIINGIGYGLSAYGDYRANTLQPDTTDTGYSYRRLNSQRFRGV